MPGFSSGSNRMSVPESVTADRIFFAGAKLTDFKVEVCGGALLVLLVFVGPLLVGWMTDVTGSYTMPFELCALIALVGSTAPPLTLAACSADSTSPRDGSWR